ncbi:unnamed protein product [Bursaphelenchus xylophilus]|uniref:(pine wood nematode) hypothetical protein n=1 Tax=Bursaphelenchus xylophilus TaxID=6326 RepID=A0A1I7SB13_BURXY|nr:unnamed protein product [Bursaphelenchus xylophilus]CAG9105915.1 unnamed protein product [Bursaphelenchus xylophilus]
MNLAVRRCELSFLVRKWLHELPFAVFVGCSQDLKLNTITDGIGTSSELLENNLQCLAKQNNKIFAFRIYNDGRDDEIGYKNVALAYQKFQAEFYVVPKIDPTEPAFRQVIAIYNAAKRHGFTFYRIFLKVTDPMRWNKAKQDNVAFINQFIKEAGAWNITVGLFTSWYDYYLITGNSNTIPESPLWYWNTLGVGLNAETQPNVNDFRTFGLFRRAPFAKMYGLEENVCGVVVNKHVFMNGPLAPGPSVASTNHT